MARPLTAEEKAVIRKMAATGYMDCEIAKKIGRSNASIATFRYREGIPNGRSPSTRAFVLTTNRSHA